MIVVILGGSVIFYFLMKHLFVAFLPFLIGWALAFSIRPVCIRLSKRLPIGERALRCILVILILSVFFFLVSISVWLISREVWSLISSIDLGEGALRDLIDSVVGNAGLIDSIFGEFSDYVAEGLYEVVMSLLSSLASGVSALFSAVPRILFFVLITVIASVYFAFELERVNGMVRRLSGERIYGQLVRLKNGTLGAFISYIRSYLIILVITFLEMAVGLLLIRAPYPIVMALFIAVLDLLPVIGVGTILIPYAVLSFFGGNALFGILILVLFVFHTVARQFLEPKILGRSLGVHPILTLIFLYVGYSFFGILGLILVPVFTVLVNFAIGKEDPAEIE